MNTAALNFHNLGMNNLMMGGAPSHGHTRPVAGVGIASMANPNAPIVSAGGGGNFRVGTPLMLPPGASFGPLTPAQPPPMWTGSGWSHDPMMDEQQDPMQQGDPMAMPFGGFRQYGGPVDPRRRYVVGENGPETFVPNQPGTILPNRGTPPPPLRGRGPLSMRAPNPRSRMGGPLSDRSPYGPQSGPLSERGAQSTGSGGMTPARRMKIAERYLASQGDPVGAARMAGSRQWAENIGGSNGPPVSAPISPSPSLPISPSSATGQLVPGRSAGSMVWQPAQPPFGGQRPGNNAPPAMDEPPVPIEDNRPMAPSPISYDQSPLAPMPLPRDQYNAIAPTAPPGMYGMQPPRVSREDITGPDGGPLGWIGFDNATGKPAGLSGNYPTAPQPSLVPIPGTNRVVPMLGDSMMPGAGPMEVNPMDRLPPGAAGPQRPGVEITPVDKSAAKPPGFTFEKDRDGRITGGVYPIQKEDGSWALQRVDINGDGKVNAAEAAAAESAAAALPAEGATRSGLKFKQL